MPMVHSSMAGLRKFQVLPIILILLAALIRFISGHRTRRLLTDSLRHAARAARLSRYFSPNLAVRLADDDAEGMLSGRRQTVAVLFVDIRGFTSMGETMTPDELSAFLAEYRSRLTEPVFSPAGSVGQLTAAATLGVFG